MMEQWVYNFKDIIQYAIREIVDIQHQRLEVEKEQVELLKQLLEKIE